MNFDEISVIDASHTRALCVKKILSSTKNQGWEDWKCNDHGEPKAKITDGALKDKHETGRGTRGHKGKEDKTKGWWGEGGEKEKGRIKSI